ncbi:MAG: tyrosine--tRNA ligase [Planctomycetota bacterium]
MFAPVEEQLALIRRGTVDLIEETELKERLQQSLKEQRPLRVKFGIDPSSPDIHLGHTVPLRKLRDFQRLGHQAIILWGTATAMLGDPSGKNKTRPQLTRDEVEHNKQTYLEQVGSVLDLDKVEQRENGEWFDGMSFLDCVSLCGSFTVARILERDSFSERYKAGEPISVHEMIYPLMQGHDSVELQCDVEIGGTDQLFNLMRGRDLQSRAGQKPQTCITTPILTGLDGEQKMSKSLGNAIGVRDSRRDMFGKCMSVPDQKMREWFELVTDLESAEVDSLLGGAPRAAKVALAKSVVTDFHGAGEAEAAVAEFDRVFRGGGVPDDVPEVELSAEDLVDGVILVGAAMAKAGLCQSNSEGRRLIQGGGVKVDGEKVQNEKQTLPAGNYLVQAGKKKFARIVVPG